MKITTQDLGELVITARLIDRAVEILRDTEHDVLANKLIVQRELLFAMLDRAIET